MFFPMVFGPKTIGTNGFSMVLKFGNHWTQWFFNGFEVRQPLDTMVFQWFSMVANHWSNDGMVTIHRSGLNPSMQCGMIPLQHWSRIAFCVYMKSCDNAKSMKLDFSFFRKYLQDIGQSQVPKGPIMCYIFEAGALRISNMIL